MAEYILREDAMEITTRTCGDYAAAWAEIRKLPAADVVEVVRCKDCEFSRELTKIEKRIWRDECRACGHPESSQDGYMVVFPDHFCSYGKRKDDTNEQE